MIEEKIFQGGLMRCCIQTLVEYQEQKDTPSGEGETLDCRFEKEGNKNMVFMGGAWKWNHT